MAKVESVGNTGAERREKVFEGCCYTAMAGGLLLEGVHIIVA